MKPYPTRPLRHLAVEMTDAQLEDVRLMASALDCTPEQLTASLALGRVRGFFERINRIEDDVQTALDEVAEYSENHISPKRAALEGGRESASRTIAFICEATNARMRLKREG